MIRIKHINRPVKLIQQHILKKKKKDSAYVLLRDRKVKELPCVAGNSCSYLELINPRNHKLENKGNKLNFRERNSPGNG